MAMTIDATHWYSWDFDVTDDTRHLAHVDVSAWGEKGVVLARATKPSAFRSAFEVRHDGRTYELAKESVWRRRFVIRSGSAEIGSLAPRRMFGREAVATLPESWPLPLKTFVIWLVVILWKRAAAAGS
jgi:hypothetical protein